MVILEVFGKLSHINCQSLFQNGGFYSVAWQKSSQSAILDILYVDSKNTIKNLEQVFRF